VVGATSSGGFLAVCLSAVTSELRLIEAESSSTLELSGDLTLHCTGESRSQPTWYHDGEQLDEDAQTMISVAVDTTNNVKQTVLTRTSDAPSRAGQYQCRDATGYQADSDVLTVVEA